MVFTQHQTQGRGQHGRTWHAPPGVLTASFVLDRISTAQLPGLSLVAGLAVIYAIEDLSADCRDLLRLKWPNDLVIDRRKLAGILCEATSGATSSPARVVVGVGLNRCVDFAEAGLDAAAIGQTVSLHEISAYLPDELALLERLRHYLLQTADILARTDRKPLGLTALLPELRRRDALLGCEVTIELPDETLVGTAIGLDGQGRLQIQLANHQTRAFSTGRVRWR